VRHGNGVIGYLLMVVYLLVCLGLIVAVLSQTSKNEGLGGTLGGGGTQSVFHGKKSVEEKLGTITNVLAVSFIVLSMVVSLALR
jgi:preprotein translocase subunit SecG